MKADKNFKLSKSSKRLLCTMTDSQSRGHLKRLLIDAELSETEAKLKSKKSRSEDKE